LERDRETSVVDGYGRAHDVPNLFVIDGSGMPTSGAVNPTATVAALALRLVSTHNLALNAYDLDILLRRRVHSDRRIPAAPPPLPARLRLDHGHGSMGRDTQSSLSKHWKRSWLRSVYSHPNSHRLRLK
jgi:hypothetical protein